MASMVRLLGMEIVMTRAARGLTIALLAVCLGSFCSEPDTSPIWPDGSASDSGGAAAFEQYRTRKPFFSADFVFLQRPQKDAYIYVSDPAAVIYYTTDGTVPSRTNGFLYSGPFMIEENTTVNAVACRDGLEDSEVATCVFTLQPEFPESPHPYPAGKTCTWTCSYSPPLAITFDPQTSLGPNTTLTIFTTAGLVEAPDGFEIQFRGKEAAGVTIHTKATNCGTVNWRLDSQGADTDWGFRVVRVEQAAPAPDFFPHARTFFNDSVMVQIMPSDRVMDGTTIRYTTDGTLPDMSNGTIYTEPLLITSTTTIKAIAYRDGVVPSGITTGTFTRMDTYPDFTEVLGERRDLAGAAWLYHYPGSPGSIALTLAPQASAYCDQSPRIRILHRPTTDDELPWTDVEASPFDAAALTAQTVRVSGDTALILAEDASECWNFRVTDVQPGAPLSPPPPPATEADRVIHLVNRARADRGLLPLFKNDLLTLAAEGHAARMAQLGFFAHQDPETGSLPSERAAAVGYGGEYRSVAENIAFGHTTPEAVVAGWLDSPGHYRNIMTSDMQDTGVGVYRGPKGIYWVQVFGRP